ncbi:hypothetical protein ACIN8IBEIGE_200095 [Acinetobacter sp. 8I-beige]|nr:hypothetical protein ACIN8IBEIGE_200095 [Acinetobacter sp. 8I-beige]
MVFWVNIFRDDIVNKKAPWGAFLLASILYLNNLHYLKYQYFKTYRH